MNELTHINLIAAWAGLLLGALSGLGLGMGFHRADFMGGYGSHKRRLYRLGHISFFGLGAINGFFWLTVSIAKVQAPLIQSASIALLVGAVAMPLCCLLMAHQPKARLVFSIPVVAIVYGTAATLQTLWVTT
ncbi:MAG: hypothetical protein HKN21_02855 [Candidatus Eisenbacteria bacterium]|uniref:DUF423 domain-containing protein n=1 Tax=Eiseniibacteriota bacterium TaxID=2212470 RepID=A0A7Y2E6N9_UNCEI|nr:hypothetical protein [Candidatus Eisenbacteria bacterium]